MLPSSCFLCVVKKPCANLVPQPCLCKVCAGRALGLSLTLDGLCESCAARFLVQGSCSFAFVSSVSARTDTASWRCAFENLRNRLCKLCAGFAWPPSNPLQKLCKSCAAGVPEQDLCSPALVSFVWLRNLVQILCVSLACARFVRAVLGKGV